jgi:protein-tyrosine-phosphatase
MAEAVLDHVGKGRFRAFSAGNQPAAQVDPLVIELIQRVKLKVDGLRSKDWNEFAAEGAPSIDFVFSLCKDIDLEKHPAWSGHPMSAYWEIDDPFMIGGSEAEKRAAFAKTFSQINWRLSVFSNLQFAKLSEMALKDQLKDLGIDRRRLPRADSDILKGYY